MDITFGLDISHYQPLSLNLAQCRRDGCEFVFLKATEGSGYTDADFGGNLAEARNAGLLVAAYVFVRSNATPAAHVALARKVIPLDVPVVLDVETAGDGSKPTLAHTRAVLAAFQGAGYRTPLIYIPRWYWQGWGSPSLGGLPPLWSSRYPDNVVGTLASEWAQVPASYWNGYGGLDVAVLQFTSSARIAGYSPLDANAYRGTRDQLAALFGGTIAPTPSPTPQQEAEPMQARASKEDVIYVPTYGKPGLFIQSGYGKAVTVKELTWIGTTPTAPEGGNYIHQEKDWTFHPDRPGPVGVPAGAVVAAILYSAEADFTAWCA